MMMNLYKGRRKWVLLGRRGGMVSLWMTAMEQMSNCWSALILCNRKGKQFSLLFLRTSSKGILVFSHVRCHSLVNVVLFGICLRLTFVKWEARSKILIMSSKFSLNFRFRTFSIQILFLTFKFSTFIDL